MTATGNPKRPTRADAAGRAYLDLQNLARREGRQTRATIAGADVTLRLDVSTGDPVAPPPALVDYPTLLPHHPSLPVLGYPLPVVLAEKLCTAVELGAGNSRVRDYTDIWTLTRAHDVPAADLLTALARAPSTRTDAASDRTPPSSPVRSPSSSRTWSPLQTRR